MFKITRTGSETITLEGRFDAAQVEAAAEVLDGVTNSTTLDFARLDYISSAGLGMLLKTQKRLSASKQTLRLINLNKMIRDVFKIARFDLIFPIEGDQL